MASALGVYTHIWRSVKNESRLLSFVAYFATLLPPRWTNTHAAGTSALFSMHEHWWFANVAVLYSLTRAYRQKCLFVAEDGAGTSTTRAFIRLQVCVCVCLWMDECVIVWKCVLIAGVEQRPWVPIHTDANIGGWTAPRASCFQPWRAMPWPPRTRSTQDAFVVLF